MAFDNLSFRQCSYVYNENGSTTDFTNGNISTVLNKDIGNGQETCVAFKLEPLNTVWNPDVLITSQIEVFFQFVATGDVTPVDPLTLVPVEYRQGLFRLPRYGDTAQTVVIYKAELNAGSPMLYVSQAKVALLQKSTRPDSSLIRGYDGSPVTIQFPSPSDKMEYTVKRLTHSSTDFVTYKPSSKLTSNLLNFQKEQEMFLLQELLWTIEMDMVTFTDLSGNGSVITADGNGVIPVEKISLSLYDLNNTSTSELNSARTILFKSSTGNTPLWAETKINNLITLDELATVSLSGLTNNHVLTWDTSVDGGTWVNKSVSEVGTGCGEKLADPLKFCNAGGPHPTQAYTDALIATDSWSTSNSVVLTTGGLTKAPIETLSNVVVSTLAATHLLQYNGTNWVNVTPAAVTGLEGQAGGSTFLYQFETTTDVPTSMTAGRVRVDDTTAASITAVYLSTTTDSGGGSAAVSGWIDSWDDNNETTSRGTLKLFEKGSPQNYHLFKVTGTIATGTTGFRAISVTHIASNGSISDTDKTWVSFQPTGDKGATGADSTVAGPTGATGPQGIGFDATGGAVVPSGSNLVFTFPMTNPAGGAVADHTVTLANWDTTAVSVGRIHSGTTVTNYGKYNYKVCLDDIDGTCGGSLQDVLNGAEVPNSGTSPTADRTFQGITYTKPDSFTFDGDEKVHGVNSVTNDLVKLLPIPEGTIVFVKVIGGVKYFQMQNVIQTIVCG